MKRHKGPLSFVSDLESIQEDELSEKQDPDSSEEIAKCGNFESGEI